MFKVENLMLHCPKCGAMCSTDSETEITKLIFRCKKCGNSEEMLKPVLSFKYKHTYF